MTNVEQLKKISKKFPNSPGVYPSTRVYFVNTVRGRFLA